MTYCPSPQAPNTTSSVFLVDDHDEAYSKWKTLGVRKRILLHLDAHIDFEWIANKNPLGLLDERSFETFMQSAQNSFGWSLSSPNHQHLHLGNYLHDALKEDLVKTWYWVVPDPMWESKQIRTRLWKDLQDYYRFRTSSMERPKKNKNTFSTSFFKVPTFIGPIKELPIFEESVILNIDVDYLTANALRRLPAPTALQKQLPWIWPDKLYSQLRDKNIVPEITTISNSVHGGYTPIAFKFLGEVLRSIFENGVFPNAYEDLKTAFFLNKKAGVKQRLAAFDSFKTHGPLETARLYQKSLLEYQSSDYEKAHQTFQRCGADDPDFLSSYNCNAKIYESQGHFREALIEYTMMKVLFPDSIETLAGEARCLAALNEPARAKAKCLQVLERNRHHLSCLFFMGKLHLAEKSFSEAAGYFEKVLALDPRQFMAKIFLGECLLKQNLFSQAKDALREALGSGGHLPVTYFLLGKTYWKLGYRKKSLELFSEWFRLILKRAS